jgi:hypothetical protein
MKAFIATCGAFLVGCGIKPTATGSTRGDGLVYRFVRTEQDFKIEARNEPAKVLVSDQEVAAEPPFRLVGVVELEGKESQPLTVFVEDAGVAGAALGCDVVVHRDAFELATRVRRRMLPGFGRVGLGREWVRTDDVVWQILCGVNGASAVEQLDSLKVATSMAVALRRQDLGDYEPCEQYTPTGSHVRKTRVCADDPGHHSEADDRSRAF